MFLTLANNTIGIVTFFLIHYFTKYDDLSGVRVICSLGRESSRQCSHGQCCVSNSQWRERPARPVAGECPCDDGVCPVRVPGPAWPDAVASVTVKLPEWLLARRQWLDSRVKWPMVPSETPTPRDSPRDIIIRLIGSREQSARAPVSQSQLRLENCEGACIRAKYGALCCVGTVNEDKIERRDTIQNMDGKREPSRNTTQVLRT